MIESVESVAEGLRYCCREADLRVLTEGGVKGVVESIKGSRVSINFEEVRPAKLETYKAHYYYKSWKINTAQLKKLIKNIEYDKSHLEEISYFIGGSYAKGTHNCITWSLKQLEKIGLDVLPVANNFWDGLLRTIVILPSIVIPVPETAPESMPTPARRAEPDEHCVIM